MSTTPTVLFEGKLLELAETVQYLSPRNTSTAVDKFTAVNTSMTDSVVLTVNLVEDGATVGPANRFEKTIPPGGEINLSQIVGHVLKAGTSLVTTTSVDAVISARASGRQFN